LDRARSRIALAIVTVALALFAGAAAPIPIRAANWLSPGPSMARALGEKPSECLAAAATPSDAYEIEIGRAAFRTPLILGGQASRAGLACENCHRGGRNNPYFLFPGVSGAPGTADVTTSLFSSHRGDGIDNPKPIPDLSGPRALLKVSRDPKSKDLKTFIHGLVTQEFDGAEPPPAVLDGLVAYVRALRPDACKANPVQAIRAETLMDDAIRATNAAGAALAHKDVPTALLMMSSARTQIGLIYERYDAPALAGERTALHAADLDLAAIQEGLRGGRPDIAVRLTAWFVQARALTNKLVQDEGKSLFDPARLAAAVSAH
jgi:hypothetical protein